ncbi:DUF4368 domain-containing protein [Dysosmobacter sp.]|uniref:DUF4368 domain-containing protein n=2 Tax=Dysosmobacter sp. TaxID=2591382 RepID=UPI003A8E8A72
MEKANFGQIVSFLFGIANDCLVDTYDVGDYRKIILPMMVIRRFDAVLEPTKEKVLKMKEQLDAAGITDQDEALCSVAGEAFCNSSPYTLSDLKSRTNQQQLKSDFILYLNGFSQNVQDIIKRFEFRNQIDKLSEHDILGLLISKFTDSSVNLSNRPIYDAKGNLVQPALDNHTMGTVFEEVIRKFNEETNIRLSRDDELAGESNSIVNQKAILKKYAKEQGFRNIQFFVDDGYSGANFNRPDWKRMIELVENDKVGVIIAKDMSRIGRNYLEVGLYTEMLFPEHDIRFIAVNSGVDSANQQDNDFTPFLNIINEFYVKDSSKKVKAVMKQKGESGEYLTTNPPYGYMKDPDNPKRHWIVDDEAAAVVRHIFAWCMEGFGPSQIAKKLKEAKVDCPTVHWMKMGRNAPAKTPDNPYDWAPRTITGILEKMEYLGHMVNFKTRKQSYRSKKKLENPQDQWKIFENTHEAIIDEETFARVQELRKNKRRPARTGKTNMFSGLVRCADCGEKLYYCTSNSFETRQDHFVCSTSRKKGKEVCDTHFIRAVVLEEGTLQHMRLVIQCVADYEDAFRRALGAKRSEEAKKDLSAKKRTLQKSENRLAELDRLFKRIYEDMVNGKLSETRFQMLADDYEQEQADLRAKIEMLENEIQNQEDQAENVDRFIRQAKKYLYLEKLTPTILNDMVNAVYVHAPDKSSGHRVQDVTISYNYIGILPANLLYDVMNGKAA